jgi:hypothetical protein
VRERGIIFSPAMVRAILRDENPKSQTRRIVKPQPAPGCYYAMNANNSHALHFAEQRDAAGGFVCVPPTPRSKDHRLACPYGVPGDRLWVRETWRRSAGASGEILFAAELSEYDRAEKGPWKPGIHMPRTASRIDLEIVSVCVERLRDLEARPDLGEADVLAEGLTFVEDMPSADLPRQYGLPDRMVSRTPWCAFQKLWDELNGKRAPWASNPWVWVITFRRIRP